MPLKQVTLKCETEKTNPEVLVIVHAVLFLNSKFTLPAKIAIAS